MQPDSSPTSKSRPHVRFRGEQHRKITNLTDNENTLELITGVAPPFFYILL